MNEKAIIEKIVQEILSSMDNENEANMENGNKSNMLTKDDYPLASEKPELVKTPTGKTLNDITLKAVLTGEITPSDVRISSETLEMQAQIAESAGRSSFARNLRRAAELTVIPDERILEIYNALRPYRSTKKELLEIAEELEKKYNAKINGEFVREAAEVYEIRNRLLTD